MSQTVVTAVLAADLVTAGTLTVSYPAGKTRGDFIFGKANYIVALQTQYSEPAGCSFAYGVGQVVITYRGTTTIPAGTTVVINMDEPGKNFLDNDALPNNVTRPGVAVIDLGSPVVAVTTGVTTAQLKGAAGTLTIDGTKATNGVATFDVPRNLTLTVATTDQSAVTFTATGTDVNGAVLVENITGPNANTVSGKKAFKTVTSVANSAAIATNGVSVGFGNILGLPCFLPSAGFIIKELQDGVLATAGTTVAGLATGTIPTATTADVRGTYLPNATPDGSKAFKLIVAIEDVSFQGSAQFAG